MLHPPVVDISQSELLVNSAWETREEFFAAYALSALINVLREPTMRNSWDRVVQAIVYVMDTFSQRTIPCLHQVMNEIFKCVLSLREVRVCPRCFSHMHTIWAIGSVAFSAC